MGASEVLIDFGLVFMNGYVVNQDYEKAMSYFKQAISAGDAAANGYVGLMYEMGYGVEVNYDLAQEYYNKAIDAGFSVFQEYLDDLLSTANDE